MSVVTEKVHAGEFLISEGNGSISRSEITVLSGQDLAAGAVLGKVTAGAVTTAAKAGNTGNGTLGTVTKGVDVLPGVYDLVISEPGTNAGKFLVFDPTGMLVGIGTVGSAFTSTHISFTLADGATDFASGDGFDITVAAGSGKYVAITDDAIDGSAKAVAILWDAVDATSADKTGVAIIRLAEVNEDYLDFADLDAGGITAAKAQLAAIASGPIIVRSALS